MGSEKLEIKQQQTKFVGASKLNYAGISKMPKTVPLMIT